MSSAFRDRIAKDLFSSESEDESYSQRESRSKLSESITGVRNQFSFKNLPGRVLAAKESPVDMHVEEGSGKNKSPSCSSQCSDCGTNCEETGNPSSEETKPAMQDIVKIEPSESECYRHIVSPSGNGEGPKPDVPSSSSSLVNGSDNKQSAAELTNGDVSSRRDKERSRRKRPRRNHALPYHIRTSSRVYAAYNIYLVKWGESNSWSHPGSSTSSKTSVASWLPPVPPRGQYTNGSRRTPKTSDGVTAWHRQNTTFVKGTVCEFTNCALSTSESECYRHIVSPSGNCEGPKPDVPSSSSSLVNGSDNKQGAAELTNGDVSSRRDKERSRRKRPRVCNIGVQCKRAGGSSISGAGPSGDLFKGHPTMGHNSRLKYGHLFHVDVHPNGGGSVVRMYQEQVERVPKEERGDLVREFFKVVFGEDRNKKAYHVIGVVHNGGAYLPDLLEYLAIREPGLKVKIGSLAKSSELETSSMEKYYESVCSHYSEGTFRFGPLDQLSLVGTVHEEAGGYFPDLLGKLEASPFLRRVMPWGSLAITRGMDPSRSNDGPILWTRPGEQMVPAGSAALASPCRRKTSRIANELKALLPRCTESRESLFEDRTRPHADHVGAGPDLRTTAAVGVLKAVHCGKKPGERNRYQFLHHRKCRVRKLLHHLFNF
ncbi:unnamed protein product [Cyprideis torosa]|uniref:Uncharacterized protein n=1 Tax=Cyprideis torosa TaxID=163714 RepID=A0A7R8ZJ34_9CRUS|nr:unnamed protein product [Cyprideis torosa]CAG0881408.1 unnamed protein product [Cyprideis torosa]